MYSKENWDNYWSRPYSNYEKHQQWFWERALPFVKGRVLDIGCGSASMWKGTDHDVTGFDYSDQAIQEAKKNCPKGKFFVGSVEEFDPGDTFDTVLSCGVVHYFLPDKLELIRKAHVNPAKGRIIISLNTPADLNLFRSWGNLVSASFQDRIGWLLVFDE